MTLKDLQTQIDKLIAQAEAALKNVHSIQYSSVPVMQTEDWAALRAAGLAFIEATFGREHSYYGEFDRGLPDTYPSSGKHALGVLSAIRDQIYGGWIGTTKGLVAAEVFADFLEMAEHLLDQGYKDAAAVIVGSVLEEHLRQLCIAAAILVEDVSSGRPVPRKADTLNADLTKAGKYNKLDQKSVTAWLDLRNKAAHGKYTEYTREHVTLMLAGVQEFATRIRP
jgi:hypothetical protein